MYDGHNILLSGSIHDHKWITSISEAWKPGHGDTVCY